MAGLTVVTGSSGFIGSWLRERLSKDGLNGGLCGLDIVPASASVAFNETIADITSLDQLRAAVPGRVDTMVHLAAKAEVVIPFEALPDLYSTNVNGTINVLSALAPRQLLFASSSAVYGNGGRSAVSAQWTNVNPVGAYGMTKAAAELACSDWARQTSGAAVSFRLGNVIGPRCRGLIPYLVDHAVRYPDGSVPARIRGRGRVVRDYVPVSYIVEMVRRAGQRIWPAGGAVAFNVGVGRGLTNTEVASIVSERLAEDGYRLKIEPTLPLEPGEAEHIVLDMAETVREFDAPVPSPEDVRDAIRAAVQSSLETQGAILETRP